MAAQAAPRQGPQSTREGPFERLAELVVVGGMALLGVAFVLPLVLVALPVAGALWGLRALPRWIVAPLGVFCLLPAMVVVVVGAEGIVNGYLDTQIEAGIALAAQGPSAFDWQTYGRAVAPAALAGGLALGALASLGLAFHASHVGSLSGEKKSKEQNLTFRDAGEMADAPERQMRWALPNVVGQEVVTLLSAPPGLGKGWWTWGLLRAMQDSGDFFGLPVRRPVKAGRWGRPDRPLRVLWLTEEGPSFSRTAKRFGIAPGLVTVLQRSEVAATEWPEIVRIVRREAWRRGCAYVIVDTIRAWCPQAEQSNDHAAAVFNLARKELAAPGLGVLFVHHDRKGGGEYSEGVAGPNNLVGSCDVLIELRRVLGDATARRMLVSRRYGDQDLIARLEGHRYLISSPLAPSEGSQDTAEEAPVPSHLQGTLEALRAAPGGLTVEALTVATSGAPATLAKHLKALGDLHLVTRSGAGLKGSPVVWSAVVAPSEAPPEAAPPPTSDPAYVRYLNSAAWATKRAEILRRADGSCEDCGVSVAPAETQVHHLTYERVMRELPSDILALCRSCHNKRHGRQP